MKTMVGEKVVVNGHCYENGKYIHVKGTRVLKEDMNGLYVNYKGKRFPVTNNGDTMARFYVVDEDYNNGKHKVIGDRGNVPFMDIAGLENV